MFGNFEEQRRSRMFMVLIILAAILSVLTALIDRAEAQDVDGVSFAWHGTAAENSARVEEHLREFFAKSSTKNLETAIALVPTVVRICEEEGVNTAIIAAMISLESTWKPTARGKMGELGLLQTQDTSAGDDVEEQLRIGIKTLKTAHEKCGTVAGALSLYGTGKSCKVYRGAMLRIRLARRIEAGR